MQDLAIVLMTPSEPRTWPRRGDRGRARHVLGRPDPATARRRRYPVGADEIAVTERLAIEHGYEVGQEIDLHMLMPDRAWACVDGGDCTTTSAGRATITAVLRMSADLAPGPYSDGLFVAPQAFLAARGGDDARWGIMTDVFLDDSDDADAVVRDYSVKVDNGDVADDESDDVVGVTHATDLQRNALLIGSAIAAAAGLLIAGQAFGRFLTRRSSDAATLAAIGMPAGQRTFAGFLPGALGSFVGAGLAIPIAIALSPLFPLRVARSGGPRRRRPRRLVRPAGRLLHRARGRRHRRADLGRVVESTAREREGSRPTLSFVAGLADRLRLGPAPTMGSRSLSSPVAASDALPSCRR